MMLLTLKQYIEWNVTLLFIHHFKVDFQKYTNRLETMY